MSDSSAASPATSTPPVVVLGAGPAGLTAGYLLARAGHPVVILESDEDVGGLARTHSRDGYRFDLGGHRFFTKNQEVDDLWHEVLDEEFLLRPRMSRIFWHGKYLDYPLSGRDVISKLGPVELGRAGLSYLAANLRPRGREDTFEQWVTNRFGRRLFELFFKEYTEKVWGVPCSELRAEWAAQRIKGLSFVAAARDAFGFGQGDVKSLITQFHYPRFGPGQMWDAMRAEIERAGGVVRTASEVERIELDDTGTVVAVHAGGERLPCSDVISSLPLGLVTRLAEPAPPAHVRDAGSGLRYRDFLTVALVVDGDDLFPDNWIYIHEPGVSVGRIQNYRSWSPWMVPDATKACVGLEYFCFAGDELWESPDEELVALATRELVALGLSTADAVERGYVTRVPKAYPMYDSEYAERVACVRSWLDPISNLQQVGRNGLHRYNNSDHSMLTAMRAVDNLLAEAGHDLWEVNVESAYHEEHVVEEQPYHHPGQRNPYIDEATLAASGVPSLSVVIPATNAPPTLEACLAGVRAGLEPGDEVVVVDDIDHHSPAHIRNYGASRARNDVLVFVDADVVLHDDALERLREAFAADPLLMAVFGSYDEAPPPGLVSSFRNLLHHNVHHEGAGVAETFWAGLGAVRRRPFLAVGGFDDERFPRPMLEDVELGMRMTDARLLIRLIPAVQGRHLKRWSLVSMLKSDFRDRGIPWTRLLIERRSVPNTLNLGWPHRFSALAVVTAIGAAAGLRRPAPLAAGAAALVALNARFYGVLHRHGGPRLVAAGVVLHAAHHATAMSALPFGLLAHIHRGGATPKPRPINSLAVIAAALTDVGTAGSAGSAEPGGRQGMAWPAAPEAGGPRASPVE